MREHSATPSSPDSAATSGPQPDVQLEELWRQGQRPDVRDFLVGVSSLAGVVGVLAVDQRQRWQRGERVPAEAYLQLYPGLEADAEKALELIYGEFLLREELGEAPSLDEYVERFPQCADRLRQQVQLHRALAASASQSDASQVSGDAPTIDDPPARAPGATPAAAAAWPQVPGYEILGEVGRGGMGVVYRAKDLRLDREVAIKVLPQLFAQDPNRLARFEREAKAVAALAHPNIVVLHAFGREGNVTFAVTELLEGETLYHRLAGAALPWRRAVEIGIAIAEGLAAAHAKGIIHRDLKPANLFLTTDSRVKILDFGLARVESKPTPVADAASHRPSQTDPGTVMGTVGYMSPEQVRAGPVDTRSDLFALGCVLYEMVAGRRAFARATAAEIMTAILHDEPPKLSGPGSSLPPTLGLVLRRCLAKKPEERFPSAQELARALRAVLNGAPDVPPSPPTEPYRKPRPRRPRKVIRSLAVLPLVNTASDVNAEYLSDGITESLINMLSQLPGLRVMARSTVFRYKGREVDAQEVGRALKVRAVLTGRLLLRGNRLLIKTELVDVADGSQLWGEHYNRELTEIFAVEEAIARDLVEKLQLRLTGEQKKRLRKPYTKDTEAYQLYLKGRYHWNKRTEEGLKKGIQYFEQAIDKDPAFALAYTGLADCYHNLGGWGHLPPQEAYPRAKAAAAKALEIDDLLAEAHTALAMSLKEYDWDWPGAEREYQCALKLNPNYAIAHQWYGEYLAAIGRHPEAIAAIQRAQELDPLSLIINATLGRHGYYFARQYDRAIEQCGKVLEMDPNFWVAHSFLGWIYAQTGQVSEALAAFQTARRLENNLENIAGLGFIYGLSGQREEARKALAELMELATKRYVSPIVIALVHVGLEERDQAFAWLEKAFEHHSQWLSEINVDAAFDSLRSDPRATDLLRRIGFPP
jgi:serine/threonine-protein kinase